MIHEYTTFELDYCNLHLVKVAAVSWHGTELICSEKEIAEAKEKDRSSDLKRGLLSDKLITEVFVGSRVHKCFLNVPIDAFACVNTRAKP